MTRKALTTLAAFMAAGIMWPPIAHAPTATDGAVLQRWQAVRVARSHADLQGRDGYRVVRTVRLKSNAYRVFWRDAPYLQDCLPGECYDEGSDVVARRGDEWWLRDGSTSYVLWMRWL